MTRPIPAALAARGITTLSDNLPPGAGLDIAKDFVRIFRPEIEARVLGWQRPFGGSASVSPVAHPCQGE